MGFVSTCHIDSDNAPVSHAVVPGTHRMMQTNGWIKEFSHITSRVHARNVGLQVFVDDYTAPGLHWRMLEELCVQRDAQTNTDEIFLYVSPFCCSYVSQNPVLTNHAVASSSPYDLE